MKCGGLDKATGKACRFRTGHAFDCLSDDHTVTHVDPRAYAADLRRLLAEMDANPARPVPEKEIK